MIDLYVRFNTKNNNIELLEKTAQSYNAITQLPKSINYGKIIVFIPATLTTKYNIDVKVKNDKQLKSVIPTILEPDLAENINNLIFSYKKSNNNTVEVCVIAKTIIDKYLAILKDINITPHYIFSELDAINSSDDSTNILDVDNYLIVKSQGDNFIIIKNMAATVIASTSSIGDNINYYSETQGDITYDNKTIKQQEITNILEFMAKNINIKNNINILDNYFDGNLYIYKFIKSYISIIILSVFLIASAYSYLLIQNNNFKKQIDTINNEMVNLYKKTFPLTTRVFDPYQQMLSKSKKQSKDKNNNFMQMIKLLSNTITKDVNIDSINYYKKELILTVASKNISSLDELKVNLAKKFIVKISKSTSDKNQSIIVFNLKNK